MFMGGKWINNVPVKCNIFNCKRNEALAPARQLNQGNIALSKSSHLPQGYVLLDSI